MQINAAAASTMKRPFVNDGPSGTRPDQQSDAAVSLRQPEPAPSPSWGSKNRQRSVAKGDTSCCQSSKSPSGTWEAEEQVILEGTVPEPPRASDFHVAPIQYSAPVRPLVVVSAAATAAAAPRQALTRAPINYPQVGHLLACPTHADAEAIYPALSSVCTTDVEASDVESMISSASAAASLMEPLGDAWDAMEVAKTRGGVVGLCESLSEFDFVCPHCVSLETGNQTDPPPPHGPIVSFSCCPRRAHYSCMVRNSTAHELARHKVPACIQCLRPADLASHQKIVQRYATQLPITPPVAVVSPETAAAAGGSRIANLWATYDTLSTHLRQQGLVKGIQEFITSDDRSKPPCLDAERIMKLGIDMRGLLRAGWSLETIVAEFKLYHLDDPTWARLGFDRNTLLELGEADLVFFMQTFNLHPYEIRRDFQIRLCHLWRSAQQRRMAGRGSSDGRSPAEARCVPSEHDLSTAVSQRFAVIDNAKAKGANRAMRATDAICDQTGFIKPRCLAILGFDLHHLLVMGFDKTHFQNFGYYTMHDWMFHLGFRKTHWKLLRLHKNDFGGRGVFAALTGWNTDLLLKRWEITPNERYAMGLLTDSELENGTRPTVPNLAPRRHTQRPVAAPVSPHNRYIPHREPQASRRRHPSRAMRRIATRGPRYATNHNLRRNYGI